MKELIEALQILLKYKDDVKYPTHCEHDVLYICGYEKVIFSEEDILRLKELGFIMPDKKFDGMEGEQIYSYKYGSA